MSTNENNKTPKKKTLKKIIFPILLLAAISIAAKFLGLFDGLGNMVTLSIETVIKVIIALVFIILLHNILIMILNYLQKKSGRTGTFATLGSSLVKYTMTLLGFCWILSIIGVNVSTIFASIGIIALILGFGAESLVADLVTGIFILFENEYNVGDIIEVDGFRGTVKNIGIRTLSLQDTGGNVKTINNSDLKNIINRSNQGSLAISDIDVAYETDLEQLDPILDTIIADIKAKHSDIFIGNIKCLGVETLGASGITLRFIAEVEEKNVFSGRRILNKELKIAFDKHHISIPFPQLDLHTK